MGKKCILVILDGWGIAENKNLSAIDAACTPYLDYLLKKYPNSKLDASGEAVGLPQGQMGNSEVGHLTIGAGRILKQSLSRINDSIDSGDFYQNKLLLKLFMLAKQDRLPIHLVGLLSDGGVHSHISHAKALCTMAKENNIKQLYLHAFTDGRDTTPGTAFNFLSEIDQHMKKTIGSIASITGRYYAMDRDNRWKRTAIAYDALTKGTGISVENLEQAQKNLNSASLTDEFFVPTILKQKTEESIAIKDNNILILFNFRTDRMRQLTHALTQNSMPTYGMLPMSLISASMTEYDPTYKNISVVFPPLDTPNTLGEILCQNKKSQLRIAETEKYPHVTYFFSGGKEEKVSRETRIMCPSPKVSTYDAAPEMAAHDIKTTLLPILKEKNEDFICVNFANADMVGHTGNFEATVKACEVIDECLSQLIPEALQNNYSILITSDHGNADKMINENSDIHTTHTLNKVPCILISAEANLNLKNGTLADIAPTILAIMNIEKPKEMTGTSLITNKFLIENTETNGNKK